MNIHDIAQKSMYNPYYEYNLLELITLITAKHDMFGCSDFMMVAAFIEGYVHSREVYFIELKKFQRWLAVGLDFSRNLAWFSGLAEKYPNDDDALKKFLQLFQEFKIEHPD